MHLYEIFRILHFTAALQFVKRLSAVQKAGESGLFVRTISLRCYKTSMQLFTFLYSERNAVVHPCKTFPMCPLWSVGEGTNLKMSFLNLICDIWFFSHRRGDPFRRCQWNLARRRGLKVFLNWPNLVLLATLMFRPQQYLEKQPKYSSLLRRRHFAAKKRPAGDAMASSECKCVS